MPWRARRPDPHVIAQLREALDRANRFCAEIGIDPIHPHNAGLSRSLDMEAPASARERLSRNRQPWGRHITGAVGVVARTTRRT